MSVSEDAASQPGQAGSSAPLPPEFAPIALYGRKEGVNFGLNLLRELDVLASWSISGKAFSSLSYRSFPRRRFQ